MVQAYFNLHPLMMRKLTTSLEPIQPNGFCRSSLRKIRHFLCICVLLFGINSLSYSQISVTPTNVNVCSGAATATLDFAFSGYAAAPDRYSIDYDATAQTAGFVDDLLNTCLLYTSPSPRDATLSRMPSSA